MLRKTFVVPLEWADHVLPPFVVLIIVPPSPTAEPLFASVKETPSKSSFVPLFCITQSVRGFPGGDSGSDGFRITDSDYQGHRLARDYQGWRPR